MHTYFIEDFEYDYNLGQRLLANYFYNISFALLLSSMVGDEYESAHRHGEAEVLVFDLVKLVEAPLLISLLLPPLLFSLAPVGDELACHRGGTEAFSKATIVY